MPDAAALPWRVVAGGVRVMVRVQPRARRAGMQGLVPDAAGGVRLRIAVTEAPEDGRANRAVAALLARALDVAPSAASVVAGASAREKIVMVAGDAALLAARLSALVAAHTGTAG
ncbi:MAG: DUF167 domain-containing protein [Alphaproteobacteria bacterium]|nr:DUF167 domain-containing protein [Alphaproteobacteria bacterium]